MELRIGSLSLTGDIPTEGPSDLQIVPVGKVQVIDALEADAVNIIDRGNYQHTITWTVTRAHLDASGNADEEAAALFVASHIAAVEQIGTSVFSYITTEGALYFTPAVAVVTKGTAEGCRTFHAYRVVAGGITSNAPGGSGGGLTAD